MRIHLNFLTEEGRTRSKNARRRVVGYSAVMLFVAVAGAYGIHRYWVRSNLMPLQKVYFRQYLKSSLRSYLPNARSHYTTLERTVTDPHTKKDISLAVEDAEIDPVLDEEGHIRADKNHHPLLVLKPGIEHKQYYWAQGIKRDGGMYEWFHDHFYESQSIVEIWRPAWLGGLLIFLFGTGGLITLDVVAQRLYLKGEAIRGTRELRPKEYAREHRKETGYGIKVYAVGRDR